LGEELVRAALVDQSRLYRNHGVVGKLQNSVRAACAAHKRLYHYNPILDALSEDNWLGVDESIVFLKVPYDICKAPEGSDSVSGFGPLWQNHYQSPILVAALQRRRW
jgi:hypothetical protein